MRAVALPAVMQDGKVQTLTQHPLHQEQWPSWIFQSNRRIARRFKKGLAARYDLNEGAYFCIRIFSDDSSFPRYELNALFTEGELQIIN